MTEQCCTNKACVVYDEERENHCTWYLEHIQTCRKFTSARRTPEHEAVVRTLKELSREAKQSKSFRDFYSSSSNSWDPWPMQVQMNAFLASIKLLTRNWRHRNDKD